MIAPSRRQNNKIGEEKKIKRYFQTFVQGEKAAENTCITENDICTTIYTSDRREFLIILHRKLFITFWELLVPYWMWYVCKDSYKKKKRGDKQLGGMINRDPKSWKRVCNSKHFTPENKTKWQVLVCSVWKQREGVASSNRSHSPCTPLETSTRWNLVAVGNTFTFAFRSSI